MRPDRPSAAELLEAVEEFLRNQAMPALEGHLSFNARVAANVVSAVRREIEQQPQIEADQHARLVELLGHEGELLELNRELCLIIRDGKASMDDPNIIDHLKRYAIESLGVDNSRYSAYKQAMA